MNRRCGECHQRIAPSWLTPGAFRCDRAGCGLPLQGTAPTETPSQKDPEPRRPDVVPEWSENHTTPTPPPKL